MDSITLSYANALSSLVNEIGLDDNKVVSDLKTISESFNNNEIKKFLYSLAVNANDKKEIIKTSLEGFDQTIIGFICVLIDNNRINLLDEIIEAYLAIIDEKRGKIKVSLKVSKELNEKELNNLSIAIQNKLFKDSDKKVWVEQTVDPSIKKGFILEYEGKIYDASMFTKLESLKEYLEK